MIKKLFFVLLLFSFSFANLECSLNALEDVDAGQTFVHYGVIAVIMLNILLIAGASMIGNAFNIPQLQIFGKDEKFHLVFSIILLLSFNSIIFFSCSVAKGFVELSLESAGNIGLLAASFDGHTMAEAAGNGLFALEAEAVAMVSAIEDKSIEYKKDSSFIYSNTLPFQGTVSLGTDAYQKAYATQMDIVLTTFVLPSLTMITLQRLFLHFIDTYTLEIILPVAFLFRTFIPTRQMGNVLLALSLGLVVVLPMIYIINITMVSSAHTTAKCNQVNNNPPLEVSEAIEDTVNGGCNSPISFWSLGKLLGHAFFLPNLALAIFITFLSSLNKALRVLG